MQEQKAPTQTRTTIAEKTDAIAGLALFPAMTVMVFIRRKIGYRFLSPVKLFVMFILLWLFAGISTLAPVGTHTVGGQTDARGYTFPTSTVPNGSPTASLYPIIIFALIMLIAGMIERYLRWREIKAGISWHTYSRGVSWFSFLPLADTQIKRFIDPAAVLIVGLLLSLLPFHFLGYYIIFSAVCLFIFEAVDYEKSINRMLDVIDNLVESEILSENAEYYTTGKPTEKPLEQTAGIPTGVSPDLAAAIERKRQKQGRQPQQQATSYPMQPLNQQYPPQAQQVPFPSQGYGQPEPTSQLRRQPPDNLANV